MAMCCRHLNRHAEADEWYEKAVAWMEQHAPPEQKEELQRFRAEAAELLAPMLDQPADAAAAIGSQF
jgi:hypothetical protein